MAGGALQATSSGPKTIPIRLLVTLVITLGTGVVAGLLLQGDLVKENVTLSIPALISFIFTIALGAGSIILAVVTLTLSRQAEDALVRRSDEGIRLQTEVHLRTTEALSGIQASTDVTEKRIEDIISGRTSIIIAQEVLDKSFQGKPQLRGPALDNLKTVLADTLRSELLPLLVGQPSAALRRLREMEERQEVSSEWRKFRSAVVDALQGVSGSGLVCEAEGDLDAETQEEFWDAVLLIGARKIGFAVYTTRRHGSWPLVRSFAARIGLRATQDKLQGVYVVLDEAKEGPFAELVQTIQATAPQCRVVFIGGTPQRIADQVQAQESRPGEP